MSRSLCSCADGVSVSFRIRPERILCCCVEWIFSESLPETNWQQLWWTVGKSWTDSRLTCKTSTEQTCTDTSQSLSARLQPLPSVHRERFLGSEPNRAESFFIPWQQLERRVSCRGWEVVQTLTSPVRLFMITADMMLKCQPGRWWHWRWSEVVSVR